MKQRQYGDVLLLVFLCSDGVGRTGTFIALDFLLQQLEKQQAVGIKDFLHRMRRHRSHMVQTEVKLLYYNKTQFSVKVILYSNYQAINFRVSKGQNTTKYYL
uniref:protein-tyrosine-phosphatase n=1 Tax=Xiphophorus maculatus TaxID=8083 RepID=A0A3B5REB8_XIPMA